MALTDNVAATQIAIRDAVYAFLEANTKLPEKSDGMTQQDYNELIGEIINGWKKLGHAVAQSLGPICDHIVANGEIDGETGHIT